MAFKVTFLCEAFATGQAAVRSLSGVDAPMRFEVAQLREAAAAERTAERPLARVSLQVSLQVARVGKALPTLAAAQQVPGPGLYLRVWMQCCRVSVMRVYRVMLGFDAHPWSAGSVEW